VRVHTDAKAAESAQAVNALAYTVGHNVVFGLGQYAPHTREGQHLLAHELTHTIQQRTALARTVMPLGMTHPAEVIECEAQRTANAVMVEEAPERISSAPPQVARQGTSPAPAAQPTFGNSCSGGTTDPCQQSRCTKNQLTTIAGDLTRAISYVSAAISALNASPLATDTARALDWYFNSHTEDTVNEVQRRFQCILTCLQDTQTNSRYGCHPDDPNLAYVCVGSTPICGHVQTDICFTNLHFGEGDRERAETTIHECAHRVGMSIRARNLPDIYRFTSRFLYLDTAESLRNSDSFALFAGAIVGGVPLTVLPVISASGGFAQSIAGPATWQARLYLGAEFQRPVLGLFNPTLGVGLSFIGETTTQGTSPVTANTSFLASLVGGIRLSDPRPGAAGGGYFSFFGGPALAISQSPSTFETQVRIGAEAGTAVGYRWRWLDVGAGLGYAYDPTRRAGMEHLVTGSISLTFTPR
jgi:hypothetical protein